MDGRLEPAYALTQRQMLACLEQARVINPGIQHMVCRLRGMMEYDNDTRCNLMNFRYSAKPCSETPDSGSTSPSTAGNPTVGDDEFQYHLCGGAVHMLSDALWEHVENRLSVELLFDNFDAHMFWM